MYAYIIYVYYMQLACSYPQAVFPLKILLDTL